MSETRLPFGLGLIIGSLIATAAIALIGVMVLWYRSPADSSGGAVGTRGHFDAAKAFKEISEAVGTGSGTRENPEKSPPAKP